MIRVIFFLALIALLAFGGAWIADRPGEIAIVWQGWRIETSVIFAAVVLAVVVVLVVFLWSILRALWRSPENVADFFRARRTARGERAIVRGLIAVGAGDLRTARKFSAEAGRLRAGEPLALLLNAQTAQLSGDRAAAETAFRNMTENEETKLLGLRGLFNEARQRDDRLAARGYAEEAARASPALAWAGQAVLEFRCAASDWDGALAALDSNWRNRLVDKPTYRRQRAVLLTAAALAAEETDRDRARDLALEAVKLAPTLVPAAELAARMLADARKIRRASRILERAWVANPHPDLAQAYTYLRFGDSARDRLARMQALAEKAPGNIEGALAVARAAIDAQEFAVARNTLAPFIAAPAQRVAELMAELEHVERGDEGRAREWMARALRAPRGPAWTADGFVSDRWLPISPVSGRIDALQWRAPVEAIGAGGAVIESAVPPAAAPAAEIATEASAAPPLAAPESVTASVPMAAPARRDGAPAEPRPEPIIPLVHAPDDPGPEPAAEVEASPEPQPENPWWRMRLFK